MFPNGELAQLCSQPWVMNMIKETKSNPDFSTSTKQVARWAREQVKRATGMCSPRPAHPLGMPESVLSMFDPRRRGRQQVRDSGLSYDDSDDMIYG